MPPRILPVHYAGRAGPLFFLALKTGFFTLLTLGMYRFWARTRLRRYFWSAIRPGGIPMEYVGDPIEKLLGFLVAVVIMAFYIGVVNLILMYFSFAFFQGNELAYVLSFVGLIPLYFYAAYRARRYILARTRWRGIRFGMEQGAWGYALRSMAHWGLAIVTLGLTFPLTRLWLEKFLTNRSYFGDQQIKQGGEHFLLYGAMKHVYYPIILTGVAGVMTWAFDNPVWLALMLLTAPWVIFGWAYWKAESFRRMIETKEVGQIRFRSKPRAGRVLGIYLLGGVILNIVLSALMIIIAALAFVVMGGADIFDLGDLEQIEQMSAVTVPVIVAGYFLVFVTMGAASKAIFTLPLAAHFAEVTQVIDPGELATIRQRDRDEFAEAEGFADALDVGAAI
ncbi:DUF898 family protein [Aliiroseovarius sp. KMU-50]|uniref:DUF898 family protein n=1 Tax=Aliiroseovarius salicola TaxID=3009082 RepID=A0ABT4VY93_9RHOB|nr:DUF898 family protein [Aliiroseovarius sp. KMU-50]MDA5093222.1 DUF898 family protein [Aliiroseovarius sp. KMU-50]